MAHVETLTTEARDHATVSTVDIRSDSLYATVYSVATGRPLGTIFAPFPGYPHYRKDWQAFNLKGEQLPGLVVGPRGALRKITREAYAASGTDLRGLIVLPALNLES